MARRRPAGLLLLHLGGLDEERQLGVLLPWAEQHRYEVVSVTRNHRDGLALVAAHLIDAVIVAVDTAGVLELEVELRAAGGSLEIVRRNPHRRRASADKILAAAARGVDAVSIALVLDVDLAEVLVVLDSMKPAGRRPQRRGHLVTGQ